MENCIFCKIAKGEIPSAKVYEDENVFAFLDMHPISSGHTLVLPKHHFENIFDIDQTALEKVIVAAKQIALTINEKLKPDGLNMVQNSGHHAGQAVFHYHLHLIPRHENDGLKFGKPGEKVEPEELKKIAEKINS